MPLPIVTAYYENRLLSPCELFGPKFWESNTRAESIWIIIYNDACRVGQWAAPGSEWMEELKSKNHQQEFLIRRV
jgi:hypothetical protein